MSRVQQGVDKGSGVRSEGLRGRNKGLGFEKGSGDKKAVLVARVNKKAGINFKKTRT